MKCFCGRFEVPQCCRRYLEDALGNLVHTETCCYQLGDGFVVSVFAPAEFTITAFSGTLKKLYPEPHPSVFPKIEPITIGFEITGSHT